MKKKKNHEGQQKHKGQDLQPNMKPKSRQQANAE